MGQLLTNLNQNCKPKHFKTIAMIIGKYKDDIEEAKRQGYTMDDIITEINKLENAKIKKSTFYDYLKKAKENNINVGITLVTDVANEMFDATNEGEKPVDKFKVPNNMKLFKFQFKQKGSDIYPIITKTQAFKDKSDILKWLEKKEKYQTKMASYPIAYELLSCEVVR